VLYHSSSRQGKTCSSSTDPPSTSSQQAFSTLVSTSGHFRAVVILVQCRALASVRRCLWSAAEPTLLCLSRRLVRSLLGSLSRSKALLEPPQGPALDTRRFPLGLREGGNAFTLLLVGANRYR
jgi:hypothetical protein